MSAYTLEIEKGCWHRTKVNGKWCTSKVPIEKRLCIFCNNGEVESEIHVLMCCQQYSEIRRKLFDTARELIVHFDSYDNDAKFTALLQTDNECFTQSVAKCIYNIFKIQEMNV